MLLSTVYHELNHIYQMKVENELIKSLYNNCYEQILINEDIYHKYHKYFIIEWNANIKAELYLDKFLDNLVFIDSGKNNNKINDRFTLLYNQMYKDNMCPLKYYINYTNQIYNEIINNKNYIILNDEEKILNGLPINNNFEINKEKIKLITNKIRG